MSQLNTESAALSGTHSARIIILGIIIIINTYIIPTIPDILIGALHILVPSKENFGKR